MSSDGDETDAPLHQIGGKGLFINTLESALLKEKADIAVHSLKDVPAKLDEDFCIAAVLKRASAGDMLLTNNGCSIKDLAINSTIATSSPRRYAQIKNLYPEIKIVPIRGNIATRISKLNHENIDGLVVAKAALERLNIGNDNCYEFSFGEMLPAASQGYIGVECLISNKKILDVLKTINSPKDLILAHAERDFVLKLNGSCLSPIAIYCRQNLDKILISARVLSQNGDKQIHKEIISSFESIQKDIRDLSQEFISLGADKLILT
jgi:hydroxymethylbilane synthase